jgi:soluble lytic murein transglycosylase-like protein
MATMIHPVGLLKMPRDIETKKSTPSLRGVKKERLFRPIILRAANRYQVDPAIIQAIIMAESGYNPKAVSRRGAKGLMQLMPRTARALGVKDSFNPEHNIHAGVRYFKQLLNQFDGDLKLALAAYNAGSRKVRRYKGIPPFKATHRYIKKVFEYHRYYRGLMIRNG